MLYGLCSEPAEDYEMIGNISWKQTVLISGGPGVWVLDWLLAKYG